MSTKQLGTKRRMSGAPKKRVGKPNPKGTRKPKSIKRRNSRIPPLIRQTAEHLGIDIVWLVLVILFLIIMFAAHHILAQIVAMILTP